MSLPKEQFAAVRHGHGEDTTLVVERVPMPQEPGPGQILVKISWAGVCGSDRYLIYDRWPITMKDSTNGVPGHEGAGRVVSVHSDVQDIWQVGDRVGIKWVASVCGKCEFGRDGIDELQCALQVNPGFNAPGTFQEYVLTDGHYATR
jgi:propanol-preferring alcohol dehydrogenase